MAQGIDREALVTENTGLVRLAVKRIHTEFPHYNQEDMYQEGCMGLIQAARTWDPDRGLRFSTLAYRCVWNAVMLYLRRERNWVRKATLLVTTSASDGEEWTDFDFIPDPAAEQALVSVEGRLDHDRLVRDIREGIVILGPLDRRILDLMVAGVRTQEQIGLALGFSQSYMARRRTRIRKHLDKQLGGRWGQHRRCSAYLPSAY